jgi:phosphopantothenoylcysteine decarboxylase/phosphopantothenate--cysteine ligase
MAEQLTGKKILLGVTGSIAAYKAAELVRRLQDVGAEVRVVMTAAACEFITPLTLQTLSGHPVALTLLDADEESAMGHITLARWADWFLIAPATADTLSRLVQGRSDDLLTAIHLASEARLVCAPAMNNKMWSHVATQENLTSLRSRGAVILGPASGDQACGEQGEGRLLEPVDIVTALAESVVPAVWAGKRVLITAGPTHEPIDPVRFIGNRSSGKMGFAVAQAAAEAGAEVMLIAGPVGLDTPTGVNRHNVGTAAQMYAAVMQQLTMMGSRDIFISVAAVADYRAETVAPHKMKKSAQQGITLPLVSTQDIVAAVAALSTNRPYVVGFAAETEKVADYAQEKLKRKGLDMIAANEVGAELGFASDDNALQVFWETGSQEVPRGPKLTVARSLITIIMGQINADSTS